MRILLFVLPCAAVGIVLGVMSAGVRKGTNIFKTQVVAWIITAVMVVGAVGIGYEKAHASRTPEDVPAPPNDGYQQGPGTAPDSLDTSFVWDNARVLSDRTVRELDERNVRLWDRYSATVGVVTCSYGGDDLYSYAMQCSEDMDLGGYDMIVVLDISGDNYWLLQGNDIRRDFTDNDCSDYAYDYMEEPFARGDYDTAVLRLTEMLEAWYGIYYG